MRNFITSIVCAGLAITVLTSPSLGQTVLNGSLTGPPTVSSAPPDWFNWQKTPDTADAFGPFNNTPTPWILSPDGGTFVRTGGTSGTNSEAFAQAVSGFTPGSSYLIEFYFTNLGFEVASTGDWVGEDGFYEMLVDGSPVGASATLSKPTLNTDSIVWESGSVSFVAPSESFDLIFKAESAASPFAAYMGIDGIQVNVPGPGSAAALATLVALAARRRRPSRERS